MEVVLGDIEDGVKKTGNIVLILVLVEVVLGVCFRNFHHLLILLS